MMQYAKIVSFKEWAADQGGSPTCCLCAFHDDGECHLEGIFHQPMEDEATACRHFLGWVIDNRSIKAVAKAMNALERILEAKDIDDAHIQAQFALRDLREERLQ